MTKRFLLLALLFVGINLSHAQQQQNTENLSFKGNHDISIGYGDYLFAGLYNAESYNFLWREDMSNDTWFNKDVYYGVGYSTGSISIGYKYRLLNWLWLGGTVNYTGFYRKCYDLNNDRHLFTNNNHIISIIPTVRFSFLNKKIVTLYGEVALGVTVSVTNELERDGFNYLSTSILPTGQITLFGISVGRNFYGFFEIGAGIKGFTNIGIGYRFKSKKNNN